MCSVNTHVPEQRILYAMHSFPGSSMDDLLRRGRLSAHLKIAISHWNRVYGSIAYYLAHRADIDRYLQQADVVFDALRQATRNADPQFHAKLMQARRQSQTTQGEK